MNSAIYNSYDIIKVNYIILQYVYRNMYRLPLAPLATHHVKDFTILS